jgi:putative selenate reductase
VAELVPVPLHLLLRRAHHEFGRRRAIFDLPERKFRRPATPSGPALDISVPYAGARAANPIGPAAGPHTQLAQNIALGWLAGARIFELKTIQINDRLSLTRPCIDMATVGYNTEWSQELSLEESLREYVKGAMLIEILRAGDWGLGTGDSTVGARDSGLPPSPNGLLAGFGETSGIRDSGVTLPDSFVFDISVGYDLEGIRSPAVVRWLESMRDASAVVDDLRREIPDEFSQFRAYPFRTCLATGITLSTFHGTPAREIERIGEFLIGELGFHTVIKLNPPMLGRERLEDILHGVLGYTDVAVNPEVYARDLPFDDAVGIIRRLQALAERHSLTTGVKCGNTLEVLNTGTFLRERVQYLSGQPLHALHAALALRWREECGAGLQISFAAGVDAHNAADCVAAGLVPVTTCTDLLRAGGYGRLPRYFVNLEERMRAVGARTITEFIVRSAEVSDSHAGSNDDTLDRAMLRNTRTLLDNALTGERYRAAQNRKPPRKLGTHLWFWDCLSCSKCIPACPNDAVFEIEVEPFIGEVPVIEIESDAWREVGRHLYHALKSTQIAIFADACNDCGNCDVFCPEDGGPHIEKPRFFGSLESWQRAAPLTGFVLTKDADAVVLRGRMAEGEFALTRIRGAAETVFDAPGAVVIVDWASHEVLSAVRRESPAPSTQTQLAPSAQPLAPAACDLSPYLTLRLLLGALLSGPRVNFANAAIVE